ncbi:NAD(P)/FAD-dependent oxidoreductase [Priestia megaterium]|uniref:NAD(P)/FAD-dependent oxidoreductase n=1 Tax=Priestia megaterium TaxID=1404 RepID=UPI002ED03910
MLIYDCTIIGGGPAGLNAALVLGRAKRNTLLVDEGKPRNAVTQESHGFLTRDGITPQEFRAIAYEEVLGYPSVMHKQDRVDTIQRDEKGFLLQTRKGETVITKKIILATGLKETLPPIPNIHQYYGKSLFVCPFCDGWELRDKPLVILAKGDRAFHLAKIVYNWSQDLIICTNGDSDLSTEQLHLLQKKGIQVLENLITTIEGDDRKMNAITFHNGESLSRQGGFVDVEWTHASHLQDILGCETDEKGAVKTNILGQTNIPGVFAAGDTSIIAPSQLIIAAGEGSKAAIGVMKELTDEEFLK